MDRLSQPWHFGEIRARLFDAETDGLDPEFRQTLCDNEARIARLVEQMKRLVASALSVSVLPRRCQEGDGEGSRRSLQGVDGSPHQPTRSARREGTTEHSAARGGRRVQAEAEFRGDPRRGKYQFSSV